MNSDIVDARYLGVESVPGGVSEVVEVRALVATPGEGAGAVDGGGGVEGVAHCRQGLIPHHQWARYLLVNSDIERKSYGCYFLCARTHKLTVSICIPIIPLLY
jgi:hypothetical protein